MISPGGAAVVSSLVDTLKDVLPILLILAVFQFAVLRRPIARPVRVVTGLVLALVGLTLFVVGLEEALFPIGRNMAEQLTNPSFVAGSTSPDAIAWWQYYWVYIFGASIGFATTIAEPALIAVATKAEQVSGGSVRAWPLRIAIATGVSFSIAVSMIRIVTGAPLYVLMIVGYTIVVVLTAFAPKAIVPLAYDSGGVATSTVTVPLVTALGLGLAATVPGRSEIVDGFGMIALAALSPMIAVMTYAQISEVVARRGRSQRRPATVPGAGR